jgi:hypothetical protein
MSKLICVVFLEHTQFLYHCVLLNLYKTAYYLKAISLIEEIMSYAPHQIGVCLKLTY